MRNKQWITQHRGGLLTKEEHRQLILWATKCAKRVLPLLGATIDGQLLHALHVAEEWASGNAPTGAAIKAARQVHAIARTYNDPVATAAARAIGHAVATAHMADHAPGGALYALMALKLSGKPIADEQAWQLHELQELPAELKRLVEDALAVKGRVLKVW